MKLYSNKDYMEDVMSVAGQRLPWQMLSNRAIMLSGATGLLGSFLVDVIMEKNRSNNLNCTVYALVRNEEKARDRFSKYDKHNNLVFVPYDVNLPLNCNDLGTIDYAMHLAANTHPLLYSTDPIGTITANIIGLYNLLEFAHKHRASRFLFASSNEVYGENRGDTELFREDYCGYINCNTLRAGYPESKRCGEALCQAYKAQKGIDVVIARLTRSYGPTMNITDSKAISQFIRKCIAGEDIVLKSVGTQFYNYTYVSDAVSGLLTVLLKGAEGEAYNIADIRGDVTLRDAACIISRINGKKVVYELPDAVESAGYSTATKARLDGSKLRALGWSAKYDFMTGVERTIAIMRTF